MSYYVDITDVKQSDLEFLGYYLVEDDGRFRLYTNKGDAIIVHRNGARSYIYVEDYNDAQQLAQGKTTIIEAPSD